MVKRLKSKYVIGYDGNDHEIILNGEVVYDEDKIIYVGKGYDGVIDETTDFGNAVISPGFIDLNALGDIDHDIIHIEAGRELRKSLIPSEEYFNRGTEELMTPEEESFKSLYAYTQLILNGITTAMPITSVYYKKWAETYEELEAAVHNAGNLGIRMYLGPSYQSGMNVVTPNGDVTVRYNEEEGERGLERAVNFVKKFDGAYKNLIKGAFEPERIECQTTSNLINTKKYADIFNCPIKLHAAQGEFEYRNIYDKYGKTPIKYLYDIGFLGKNVGIPHCYIVSNSSKVDFGESDDLEILKKSGTTAIHCPVIIGRSGHYMESFAKYKRMGISIAMGTDTFPPDFFQNIRVASMYSRMYEGDVEDSRFADIFRAATLGGAQMLGREDLGRLCKGAKADIIVINLDSYHMGAIDDPIRTMIMCGSGTDVVMSVIDGRTVMKDRKIEGIDLEEMKEKAQNYYDKMKLGYMKRDYRNLPMNEIFKPSFKIK